MKENRDQTEMARPRRNTAKIQYRVPGSDSEDETGGNESENPFFLPMEIPRMKLKSADEPKVKTNRSRSDDRTVKKPRRKEIKASIRMNTADSKLRKPEMSDSSTATTTLKAVALLNKYQSEEESIASFSMGKETYDSLLKTDSSPIKPMSLDFDLVSHGQMSGFQSEEEEIEESSLTQVNF